MSDFINARVIQKIATVSECKCGHCKNKGTEQRRMAKFGNITKF